MRSLLAFTTPALLAVSAICSAQPPGITPEMIATALPEEGAPKAEPGPYEVSASLAYEAPALRVFQPSNLAPFPIKDTLPVVVWGNGGCAIDGPRYAGFLTTIASHGFLVITTAALENEPRRQATADDLKSAIDWAERENARSGSPLAGKIATQQVAVMGQSCGGMLSITLGSDPRVDTIGVFNAGVRSAPETSTELQQLRGPALFINGHERDFAMANSKAAYDAINKVPAFYGARHGAGHTATAYHPGGGEFANVAVNWARWQLKNDTAASSWFVGAQCRLCTDPNWEVASKGLTK